MSNLNSEQRGLNICGNAALAGPSPHTFQQDAAAHNWSIGELTPPGEVKGDPGVQRDLLAQLFISVY